MKDTAGPIMKEGCKLTFVGENIQHSTQRLGEVNPALSTAADYITRTLTNIAKTMSVSMSNTGGCATTTATTNDGGG